VPKGLGKILFSSPKKHTALSMAELLRNAEKAVIRAQNITNNDLAYSCETAWAQYYWTSYLKIKGTKHLNMKVAGVREMLEAHETDRVLDILRSVSNGLALENISFAKEWPPSQQSL
jgi:hypothetical protein